MFPSFLHPLPLLVRFTFRAVKKGFLYEGFDGSYLCSTSLLDLCELSCEFHHVSWHCLFDLKYLPARACHCLFVKAVPPPKVGFKQNVWLVCTQWSSLLVYRFERTCNTETRRYSQTCQRSPRHQECVWLGMLIFGRKIYCWRLLELFSLTFFVCWILPFERQTFLKLAASAWESPK